MVKQGDAVKVHYKGTLEDGTVFDSSEDKDPITFRVGDGNVIQGFEDAVVGMTKGDTKTITIVSDDAYGPVREDYLIQVPLEQVPEGTEVRHLVNGHSPSGEVFNFIVTSVSEDMVTLDGNHPLAGKDLTFEITLDEIVEL